MKPLVQEWIDKAEGDFATAGRDLRARKAPNYDSVCFHSQQCVEKYLKAYLQDAGIAFAKTHDLVVLLDLIVANGTKLESISVKITQFDDGSRRNSLLWKICR
jgi:HEPN domain-containing protein